MKAQLIAALALAASTAPLLSEGAPSPLRSQVRRANLRAKPQVHITTGEQFSAELGRVVTSGAACSAQPKYTVAEDLYGTANGWVGTAHQPEFIGTAKIEMAWLSNHLAMGNILNHHCCGVASLKECFCNTAAAVGLFNASEGMTFKAGQHWEYIATQTTNVNNKTNGAEIPDGGVNLIVPTWANMAVDTPDTFEYIFKGTAAEKFSSMKCSVSSEVISELESSSYADLYEQDAATFKEFGCGSKGTGCSPQDNPKQKYIDFVVREKGFEKFCSNPAALRAYMMSFFDANFLFEGTGYDDNGPEVVIIPNLKIAEMQKGGPLHQMSFELSKTEATVCPPQ